MKIYKTHWQKELRLAKRILKDENVAILEFWRDYICFKILGDGFRIVVYPHKTSAHNYHLRVRGEAVKNESEADRIMSKLNAGSGFNCTFSRKAR